MTSAELYNWGAILPALPTPIAYEGDKRDIVEGVDNAIDQRTSVRFGLPYLMSQPLDMDGIPVPRQDLNGLFFSLSQITHYLMCGGAIPWSNSVARVIGGYPKGAVVLDQSTGVLYRSMVDSNLTTVGMSGFWVREQSLSLLGGDINGTIWCNGSVFAANRILEDALRLYGGSNAINGASLFLCGQDNVSTPGGFVLSASRAGGSDSSLVGLPDGDLKWRGKTVALEGDYVPLSGSGRFTTNFAFARNVGTGYIGISGGSEYGKGARIDLCGEDHPSMAGQFRLVATIDGAVKQILYGTPSGTLRWNDKDITLDGDCLPLSGGTITGSIKTTTEAAIVGNSDSQVVRISGGTSWNKGSSLLVYGKDHASYPGEFRLRAYDGTSERILRGLPDGRITWGASQVFLPAGAVFAYAGRTTPTGCLMCNGAEVSRTTYATLFAAIGTTYGAGDGSNTFNLPDLTDRFIQGSETPGTVHAAGLPNITGTLRNAVLDTAQGDGAFSATEGTELGGGGTGSVKKDQVTFDASNSDGIYGASNTVQPPALTMQYFIKY